MWKTPNFDTTTISARYYLKPYVATTFDNPILSGSYYLVAFSDINIGQNTVLNFTGNAFTGKSIAGQGKLCLNHPHTLLGLCKVENLDIKAIEIELISSIVVTHTLKIDSNRRLLLNGFNLYATHAIFQMSIAKIVQNSSGRVIVYDRGLLSVASGMQVAFSIVNPFSGTILSMTESCCCASFNMVVGNPYYSTNDNIYIAQYSQPPLPPPKQG